MTPEVRRKALLAVSKVALLGIAGCGGTTGGDVTSQPDGSATGGETALSAGGGGMLPEGSGSSSGNAPSGGTGAGGVLVTAGGSSAAGGSSPGGGAESSALGGAGGSAGCVDDQACCAESIAALQTQSESGLWSDFEMAQSNPLVQACCSAALEGEEPLYTGPFSGCCEVVEGADISRCAPWGPPPPPAFSGGWA